MSKGAYVNTKTDSESTALHLASSAGFCDLALLLLEREAHPNARDADRATALHLAAQEGHEDVAKWG